MSRNPWNDIDPVAEVQEEAAEYVDMTPEERGRLVAAACRGAAALLAARPDAQRAIDWQDPLPESSMSHLAELRAQWRTKRGKAA